MAPESNTAGRGPAGGMVLLLWAVLFVEVISPNPAFLLFGAVWVLLTDPSSFLALVRELYGLPPVRK